MVAIAENTAENSKFAIGPVDGHWPADQYVTVRGVPVFAEHRTKTKDGRELRFGQRELQAVADRCNRRIRETGDYAVVCLGHTPDLDQKAAGVNIDPEVVGFAGPFRVDLVGRSGKFAIVADMHYFQDPAVLEKVKKHPRRSPELWKTNGPYEEMHLDPITLLGAEAPRLDMGLFYTATTKDGQQVEKYSAAACPSASSVFVPSDDLGPSHGKKNYEANQKLENTMISPEDVKQIVDAITQTDWARWVVSKMQAEIGSNATIPGTIPDSATPTPSVDVPKPAGILDPELPAGGPSAGDGGPAAGGLPTPAAPVGDAGKDPPPAGGYDDDENDDDDAAVEKFRKWRRSKWGGKKNYSAEDSEKNGKPECKPSDEPAGTLPIKEIGKPSPSKYQRPEQPERYSALEAENVELRGRVERYRLDLESERATRIDAERYSRLSALRQRYAFDLDREHERSKYGKMSDGQFAEFAGPGGMIESNFQPIPIGSVLPTFDTQEKEAAPGAVGNPEKYSKSQRDQAMRYCESQATAGKHVDYMEVLERVKAGEKLE
ncbi:hypothetical protein [Trichococcus shcherbakoviae]|uniref:hypothetical protein n=1 Tax=Trichococcus shcherbakoviae TaxID=2094020 RepID=UPI002AA86652|nr:hypothetical protein [Trichococcus shcherbakoviae]